MQPEAAARAGRDRVTLGAVLVLAAAAVGFIEIANLNETSASSTAIYLDHRERSYCLIWTAWPSRKDPGPFTTTTESG